MPRLKPSAPKQEKKARAKEEFDKFGKGKLKSSSGQKVTNPKQAVAIALSESGQSKKDKHMPKHKKDSGKKAMFEEAKSLESHGKKQKLGVPPDMAKEDIKGKEQPKKLLPEDLKKKGPAKKMRKGK
jgi:hypothetical protein